MQGFPWWSLEHLTGQGTWTVEDIGAHLSNRTWLVKNKHPSAQTMASQLTYVVKQFRHGEEFGRDSKQVLNIDNYVAELGLGPRVVFVSEDLTVVIYEYLNKPLLSEVTDDALRIQRVAQALAQIHQLTPELKKVTLRSQLEQYCLALEQYKPKDAARMREDIASYQVLFDKCEQQPQVFCHNDLSMDHIFVTPELKIIDWEYAGYNHPGMDIAMAVVMNDLYEEEINCLLNEYNLHSVHSIHRDDLPDWLRVVALVNRVWFKVQEAVAESATAISAD